MQRLQEFSLTTAEVLNAIEEYIRNISGTLSTTDKRAGCRLTKEQPNGETDPTKDCAATMSFRGEK